MPLRWKLSLVVLVAVIVLIGTIFTISQITFARDFQNVESQRAVEMAQRASNALTTQIQNLETMNYDYSVWDDTYAFVLEPEKHHNYIQTNLIDTTFTNIGINFLIINDLSGHNVFSRGFDLTSHNDLPVPNSLASYLSEGSQLHKASEICGLAGLVILPEGPLLVSIHPILNSEGQGPAVGTMTMARFIDSDVLDTLEDNVLLPVSLVSVTDLPSHLLHDQPSFGMSTSTASEILDSERIAGYSVMNDTNNNPAITLKVVIPRDINARGVVTTRYFIFSLLLIGVLFTLVINLLMGKLVTSRVHRVGTYIDNITDKGDYSKRLPVSGNDELTHLSVDVNQVIQALQESRDDEHKLRSMIDTATDGIAFVTLDGKITDLSDSKSKLHGYNGKNELIGTKILDLVTFSDRLRARDTMEEAFATGHIVYHEYTLLKKDGNSFLAAVYVITVKDDDKRPTGFIVSTKDISKRQSNTSQLSDQNNGVSGSMVFVDSSV